MDARKNARTEHAASAAARLISIRDPLSEKLEGQAIVFLRRHMVEARTGLSRSSIYDRIAEGTFPKPIPLGGRSVGWLESEIVEWQKARIAERAHKAMLGARRSAP